MTLTPDQSSAGPIDDATDRPTVVLPGQRRTRPPRRPSRRPPRGVGPFLVVAVANALWAALWTFIPVLLIFLAVTLMGTPSVTVGTDAKYAVAAWVLAHGVPLTLAGYPLGLTPLAISALAAWRLGAAGRRVARASRVSAPAVVATIGIAYGAIGVIAAALASDEYVSVPLVRTGLTCAAFGLVCAALGTSGGRGLVRRKVKHVSPPIRDGVRAGLVAAAIMIATGAAAAGVAIALGGSTAAQMLHGYHAGVTGQAGIVLICLAYAPNVSVWAAAYLAGPGFTLAGVPAQLPVFAGLPSHPLTGAAQLLLLAPVVAGIAGGILAVRRRGTAGWRSAASGPVAGVVSTLVLALAGRAAAGPLGSKLLAHTGEVGWQFPLVAGAGITVGTLLGLGAYVAFTHRPPSR